MRSELGARQNRSMRGRACAPVRGVSPEAWVQLAVESLAGASTNLVNFVLRTVFYAAEQLAELVVLELAAAPVLLALAAYTVVAARHAVSRSTTAPPTGTPSATVT